MVMNIRERKEAFEEAALSKYASLSKFSKGRANDEEPCEIRTCYQRDRDRIIHCKAFRRMEHKTQVFLSPTGDHYRTRLTHTLEVSQIARTIATSLWLNEDLTEAIALGHDIGHTPFGHEGERALSEKCEFEHAEQSIRIAEVLENNGKGLNLTYEVKDGIRNHSLGKMPETLEGRIVRLADKIAYIHHDMDDAIRAGILCEEQIPEELTSVLGKTRKERLDYLVKDIISHSEDKNDIIMSDEAFKALIGFRKFLTEELYFNPVCKSEESKAHDMLIKLYEYYLGHLNELPPEYLKLIDRGDTAERAVCDYISGMTDHYSVETYNRLFVPKFWEM